MQIALIISFLIRITRVIGWLVSNRRGRRGTITRRGRGRSMTTTTTNTVAAATVDGLMAAIDSDCVGRKN